MENQIKNGYVKLQKPTTYRRTVAKTERHLLDIDLNHLDVDKLLMYKKGIPSGYMLRVIDRKMYEEGKRHKFSSNFLKAYPDYTSFQNGGFGYYVLEKEKIVAGISAFIRYQTGVEVKVAVLPEHRGKHLARALSATFLMECKVRNLYPWWDCSCPATIHIAKELGYYLKQNAPAC
ncbi:MAG: GNAT family N-acetyltransferase [Lachnospiraceae bacterium]|nr:GNAT family N-acetyltransferase [Lachnospiraceae bacterium]